MAISDSFSGIVYVGRRTLRSQDEPSSRELDDGKDELEDLYPEAIPHTFVKFDNVSIRDLLESPSNGPLGSSGIVVQYQKLLRNDASPAEVDAWRERFTPEYFEETLETYDEVELINGTSMNEWTDAREDILHGAAPFVVLDADDVALDVPAQVSDMRRFLRNAAEGTGLEDQIEQMSDEKIRTMYENLA